MIAIKIGLVNENLCKGFGDSEFTAGVDPLFFILFSSFGL
jgi:hypothetical protein